MVRAKLVHGELVVPDDREARFREQPLSFPGVEPLDVKAVVCALGTSKAPEPVGGLRRSGCVGALVPHPGENRAPGAQHPRRLA